MPHVINDFSNFKVDQLQDRLCLPGEVNQVKCFSNNTSKKVNMTHK